MSEPTEDEEAGERFAPSDAYKERLEERMTARNTAGDQPQARGLHLGPDRELMMDEDTIVIDGNRIVFPNAARPTIDNTEITVDSTNITADAEAKGDREELDDGMITEGGEAMLMEDGEPVGVENPHPTFDSTTVSFDNTNVTFDSTGAVPNSSHPMSPIQQSGGASLPLTGGFKGVVAKALKDATLATADVNSASWTGQRSFQDHVRAVRALTPLVQSEIHSLVQLVEAKRFNDPETEAALHLLRSLHRDLGALIEAVEDQKDRHLIARIARKNAKLVHYIKSGAKIGAVAPALTIGISHVLSALTNVPIDSTMISTVFASMIAMPLVEERVRVVLRPPSD